MLKKFTKSLRYTDEFLLSTNDYYLKGINSATLVILDKIYQTCFFECKSMKSEKFLFQLFLTTLKIAHFEIALDFKILK